MVTIPYQDKTTSKKQQITEMFNNISGKYDFLNHFLSFGIDILWRKKAIRKLKGQKVDQLLDAATGTGDFAIRAMRLNPKQVIGIDISEKMLDKGKEKINKKGLNDKIKFQVADSENLPFDDNTFDITTMGFGIRNFEHPDKGLQEIYRTLTPEGAVAILEFSQPQTAPFKQLYHFYFKQILPILGRMISKDPKAYTYLYESASEFPYGEKFAAMMKKAGFNSIEYFPLAFGVATLYMAKK